MRALLPVATLVALAFAGPAWPQSGSSAPASAKPPEADSSTLYALGAAVGGNLKGLRLTAAEIEVVQRGFGDALAGRKLQTDPAANQAKIKAFGDARLAATAKANKEAGASFVAKAAAEKNAQKTASGAVYQPIHEGTGAAVKPNDDVKVTIVGKLADGTVFDDGSKRPPAEFMVGQAFPCLSEGLQKMKVGGTARLVCPSDTAFGERGQPPAVLPGAAVAFEVKVLEAKPRQMPSGHAGMPGGHPAPAPAGKAPATGKKK